jgi:hypothetical protein
MLTSRRCQFIISALLFLALTTLGLSLSLAAAPSRLVIGYASTTPRLMPLWSLVIKDFSPSMASNRSLSCFATARIS